MIDVISRQAVLDIINFEDKWLLGAKSHNVDTKTAFWAMKSKIFNLPSVTPEPCEDAVRHCVEIIDKYKAESEDKK